MKKILVTATALMFALGLTVTAQAQGTAEKSKTAPVQVQKVTTPELAQKTTKTENPKVAPVEGKKLEPTATGKKVADDKGKQDKEAAAKAKTTVKEEKTSAGEGKKPGPASSQTEKK